MSIVGIYLVANIWDPSIYECLEIYVQFGKRKRWSKSIDSSSINKAKFTEMFSGNLYLKTWWKKNVYRCCWKVNLFSLSTRAQVATFSLFHFFNSFSFSSIFTGKWINSEESNIYSHMKLNTMWKNGMDSYISFFLSVASNVCKVWLIHTWMRPFQIETEKKE